MNKMETFEDYLGREQRAEDTIMRAPLQHLAAMLDSTVEELAPDGALPPLGHWGFFLDWPRQSRLGADGHAERGDFLPPIALPRRMLAGVQLRFHQPLRIGEPAHKTSRIESIQPKEGRSGQLYFVTVHHRVDGPSGLAIEEEQTIVYRTPTSGGGAAQPKSRDLPGESDRQRGRINPDPTLLFRFSAFTGNAHRIHYDRTYATETEGYPGLVVHGPLQALLLLDTLRLTIGKPLDLAAFSFRSQRPLFDVAGFDCTIRDAASDPVALATLDNEGNECTVAEATMR